MTSDEQLAAWLKGESIHNTDRDECCPDFSCCCPELLADEAVRRAFVNGDEKLRWSMLGIFLSKMIEQATSDKNVYLAGFDDPEEITLQ